MLSPSSLVQSVWTNMKAISTGLCMVPIKTKPKTFQRKTRRYNVVDRLQRTHGHPPSHRTQGSVNLTCKHAPGAPSPQPKTGVPYGTQQRPEELEVFGSHSGHGSLWPPDNFRRPAWMSSHSERHRALGHPISVVTTSTMSEQTRIQQC